MLAFAISSGSARRPMQILLIRYCIFSAAVWQQPEIRVQAKAGETLTLQISVSGSAGSYGSADDCTVAKITEEKPPEKLAGDLNNDGKTDAADVRLLLGYLLTASDNIDAKLADFSGDGIINAVDLTLLERQILQS